MGVNAEEFVVSLDDEAKALVQGDYRKFRTRVVLGLLTDHVTAAAVGNPDLWKSNPPHGYAGGSLRNSFYVTDSEAGERTDVRPSGRPGQGPSTAQVSEASASIQSGNVFGPAFLRSDLPYARRVMNDGWSSQTPPATSSNLVARYNRLTAE